MFQFHTLKHCLILSKYSFTYPQFLRCSGHIIEENMEWGRKTIEIALVAYRNGYLVNVHRLGTVEYILRSLVQLKEVYA
jgi:hypothetical protein